MCILITTTLPMNLDRTTLVELIDRYDLYFQPIQNEYINKQFENGDIYLKATKWGCDCKTGLGSYKVFSKRPSLEQFKSMEKEERKQFQELINQRNDELKSDAEKWLKFIGELFEIKNVTKFGLLIHFYRTGIEEEFIIKRTEKKNIQDISVEFLMKMEEDILYQFASN